MNYDRDQIQMLVNVLVQSGLGDERECVQFLEQELIPFAKESGYDNLLLALVDFPDLDPPPGTIEHRVLQMLNRLHNRVH